VTAGVYNPWQYGGGIHETANGLTTIRHPLPQPHEDSQYFNQSIVIYHYGRSEYFPQ